MGFIADEDSWNQWRYHMSAFEINEIHGNTSLFRSESGTSEPLHLWLWSTCQMWTELGQRATKAALWLALCPAALHSGTDSPSECDYLSVQPITSTVRSPLSPVFLFTYFKSAFTCSISVWFTLTLSLTISLYFLPITKTSGAAGCLLTQEPRGTQLSSWMV